MTFYLAHTILEEHHHAHSHVALLDELHNRLVISLLHIIPVDGEYNIALAHARPVGRSTIFHIVHIGDHLQLLVALVMDAIALQREAIRVVLLLHYDGATPAILILLGGQLPLRFVASQDVCGTRQLRREGESRL